MNAWEARQIADKVNESNEFEYWIHFYDFALKAIEENAKKGGYRLVFKSKYKLKTVFKVTLEHLGYKVKVLKDDYHFEVSWKE